MRANRWIALVAIAFVNVCDEPGDTRMMSTRQPGTTALAVDFDRAKNVASHALKV